MIRPFICLICLLLSFINANEDTTSQTFGYYLAETLKNESDGLKLDLQSVSQGFQMNLRGEEAPLTLEEYEKALATMMEEKAQNNLAQAEQYIKRNCRKEGFIALQEDRLYFQVIKKGSGEEVKKGSSPLVSYTGRFADGTVFGSSEDTGPICIALEETIPGFSEGILGMKKGEKRRLFIHPDLAYGTQGQLPPNSLLIFDIEVIEVDEVE